MSLLTRKIILWSVMTVFGAGLLFWWVNNFQKNLTGFQGGKFIEGLNLPEIKMPQIPEINYGQQNNQQDK